VPSSEPGPPRRAPVVEREVTPDWPTEDGDYYSVLEMETPTERIPAYQDVVSRWFQPGVGPPPPMPLPEPEPPTPRPIEPEPEPVWPTAEEIAEEWPYQRPEEYRPILSLFPDEVRERMSSLQGGVRRGRHASDEVSPDGR
jgi:hypothetical protein